MMSDRRIHVVCRVTMAAVTGAIVLSATAQDAREDLHNERAAIAHLRELGGRLDFEERRLVRVDLSRVEDGSAAIAALRHFPTITHLDWPGGAVDADGFEMISKLEALEHLNLAAATVDDTDVARLKSGALLRLDLSGTDVTDEGLAKLVANVPRLQGLNGGDGDDILKGGEDNDKVYGRDGDDVIEGGGGKNWLYGGAGQDRFRVIDAFWQINHLPDHDWLNGELIDWLS